MTQPNAGREPKHSDDNEISTLAIVNFLLRWRRSILAMGLCGAVMGLAVGALSRRVYMSAATFIPQGSEGGNSGLVLAASQFGIRVPTSGGAWVPAIYVELLHSRGLLEPLAFDTVAVVEERGRRVALMDLLEIKAPTPSKRVESAVRALRTIVTATEDKRLGAVKLTVTTRWPSVSLKLGEQLLRGVNQFNVETRKSQAAAERQFVEAQAGRAERALREAEDRMQLFLQQNRAIASSPELAFRRDRLQRDVALRQQVYTTLLQNLDDAKIREVRDTPVLTVLEAPRLAAVGESRKTVLKAILGGLAGGMLGVLMALFVQSLAWVRRSPDEDAREFVHLLQQASSRFPWHNRVAKFVLWSANRFRPKE